MQKTNICIIGGGVIGSSIAYFLARTGRAGTITVIEPDPTYTLATTPKGAGGVRQLFSQPENIAMSKYSLQFYKQIGQILGEEIDIDFKQRGYLFVVGEEGAKQLEINFNQQTQLGVDAILMSRDELRERFPSMGLTDVALGCFSPGDGTLTTAKVLHALKGKAESLGVDFVQNRVVNLVLGKNQVQAAVLENGKSLQADLFVNGAGAWADDIARMAGLSLPIVPMCRVKHYWTCSTPIEPLPLVKDESTLFFRPQGDGFVGGRPSWEIKPGFNFAKDGNRLNDYFDGYFNRVVRPLLQIRLPAFESAVEHENWTGHYAQNTFDGNMILGQMGATATNLYTACGFSGHGIMHAPAVGMALSELILDDRFDTIDLHRMSYQRLLDDAPYPERGII